MKTTSKILLGALCGIFAATLPACSDSDTVTTPLSNVTNVTADVTCTTVTINWNPVQDATKYGITLYDEEETALLAEVTKGTEMTFEELTPGTQYTVVVQAFALIDSDHSSSALTKVSFTTTAASQLDAPTSLTSKISTSTVQIKWDEVDNATTYECRYSIKGAAENTIVEVTTNQATLRNLDRAIYTVQARAISDDPAWLSSEWSDPIEFTFAGKTAWTKTGTYTSAATGETWRAQIACLNEATSTFSITAWYGTPGYYLDFTVNYQGAITILNGVEVSGNYTYVATDADNTLGINVSKSSFSGNKSSGSLNLTVPGATGTVVDTFVW